MSWFKRKLFFIKRRIKWFFQRRIRGFDDSEIFSLDYTILEFLLPRLKRYRKIQGGHPGCLNSSEEWEEILDKIIFFVEYFLEHEGFGTEELEEKSKEGRELFFEYFHALWF